MGLSSMAIQPPWLKADGAPTAEAPKIVPAWAKAGVHINKDGDIKVKTGRVLTSDGGTTKDSARENGTLMPVSRVPEPPTARKLELEEFARQYLVDFNQTRAAVRMGYEQKVASERGNMMFWMPYTQAYLVALIRSLEEKTIVSRNQVLAGLLAEANNYQMDASSASRIAAWREIAKILGMYIVKVEVNTQASGVMQVPLVRNAEEWGAVAGQSQNLLMEAVRL